MALTRVQYLGKLATSVSFCEGSLKQALTKADAFYEGHQDLNATFADLKEKDIPEERVLDKSLNLGSDAGILKCFFSLERRVRACRLALGHADEENDGHDGDGDAIVPAAGSGDTGSQAAEEAKVDAA